MLDISKIMIDEGDILKWYSDRLEKKEILEWSPVYLCLIGNPNSDNIICQIKITTCYSSDITELLIGIEGESANLRNYLLNNGAVKTEEAKRVKALFCAPEYDLQIALKKVSDNSKDLSNNITYEVIDYIAKRLRENGAPEEVIAYLYCKHNIGCSLMCGMQSPLQLKSLFAGYVREVERQANIVVPNDLKKEVMRFGLPKH